MTKTEIYQLPQWEATDRVLREDFNEAFAQVEASIPRIAFGTYVGTGAYKTSYTELDVGFAPRIICIDSADGSRFLHAQRGTTMTMAAHTNSGSYYCNLIWTDTGVRWINNNAPSAWDQLNQSGATYYWFAIG